MIHYAVCYYLSDMRTHRPVHGIIKIKVTVSLINYKKNSYLPVIGGIHNPCKLLSVSIGLKLATILVLHGASEVMNSYVRT